MCIKDGWDVASMYEMSFAIVLSLSLSLALSLLPVLCIPWRSASSYTCIYHIRTVRKYITIIRIHSHIHTAQPAHIHAVSFLKTIKNLIICSNNLSIIILTMCAIQAYTHTDTDTHTRAHRYLFQNRHNIVLDARSSFRYI